MRVLTISKPYVAMTYREKLEILHRDPRFEMGLICPRQWDHQAFEPGDESFPVFQLDIRFNGKNHFHYYRRLEEAIAKFNPDLLNVEEEHYSIVTAQCFRIARKRRIPAVFYTWQNIDKAYPPPFSMIENYIFNYAAAAVVGNLEAKDILRRKGFAGPVEHIPQMGVSWTRFHKPEVADPTARKEMKSRLNLNPEHTWVGFFGRIVEEKGLQDVIAAMANLPAHVQLLIVGKGNFQPDLVALAKSCNVSDRIHFRDFIPSSQVADFLQAVEFMCLPSLTKSNWKEQFGRILVESMAAGAIPIGSSSGEIPHVIGPGGIVFAEGNSSDFVQKLTPNLAEDAQSALRKSAIDRAKSLFTNDVIAAKYGELFQSIRQNGLPQHET